MAAIDRHIFLTGFMGSGKTTAGKKLAHLLQMTFMDLDEIIVDTENKSIPQIFEEKGEDYFRTLETKSIAAIDSQSPFKVIALGGGAVCFNNNLELIKSKGLLVYLEMPAAALADRLKHNQTERPLLRSKENIGLEKHITQLLEKRIPYYQQADLILNGLNLDPAQIESIVRAALSKNSI